MSLGRNAIAVVIGTLMAYIFDLYGMTPFNLTGCITEYFSNNRIRQLTLLPSSIFLYSNTGNVEGGLPKFQPPPFSTTIINENNQTIFMNFQDMVTTLGTGIISLPMISVLETIAIAKAFGKN